MKLTRKHVLRVKGQAELIGALFALMVLVMLIVYTVANVLPSASIQQMQMQEVQSFEHFQELEKEELEAIWNPENSELTIRNNSTIPVKIVRIWVEEDGNVGPMPVDPDVAIIEPRGEKKLSLSVTPLRVETARGTIVYVKTLPPRQPDKGPESDNSNEPEPPSGFGTKSNPVELQVLDPASLASNPNVYIDRKLVEEPTLENVREGKTGGMVRYLVESWHPDRPDRYVLILEKRYENVCVDVRGTPGIFVFGYAPGSHNKLYNALLTGTERGLVIRIKDCETGQQIEEIRLTPTDYARAKILGLNVSEAEFRFRYQGLSSTIETNVASEALGYWYYHDPGRGVEMYLELVNGVVEKLKIYRSYRIDSPQESSYEPYLLTADVDGNDASELIFIDEDIRYGVLSYYGCTFNDLVRRTAIAILDVSTAPFLFYLKGYPIDPEKHGGVMISLRWYFHDNEGADHDCVEESGLPILSLYLVDPGEDGEPGTEDDKIVVSSEYIYQYLTKFEDTYPPNQYYVTFTVTLVVPENVTANKLYVAIGFNDPYAYRGSGWDDVDITLAVEVIGITFLPRLT